MANTFTDEDYEYIVEKFLGYAGVDSSFEWEGMNEMTISLDGSQFCSTFSFKVSLNELSKADSEEEVNAILAGRFYNAFVNTEREELFDDFFAQAEEILEFTRWEITNWVIDDINFFINLANKFVENYSSEQDRVRELFFEFAGPNGFIHLPVLSIGAGS